MARQRMVKPDFFASESLGACRPEARLAFIGLWVEADDKGHLKCQFRKLRNKIFPYDAITDMSFAYLLAELERVGCISGYEVGGERYLCVRNFSTYQTIQRPSKTNIPEPPMGAARTHVLPSWIAEMWPLDGVENPVENTALNECSLSTHPKERKKEGRRIYLGDSSSSEVVEDGGAVENPIACPPSITEAFRRLFS